MNGLGEYLSGGNNGPGGAVELSADQARRIAHILSTADGGCSYCVSDLCGEMATAFPGHDWRALAGLRDES
jgi:hypothetical protein